MVEAVVVSAAEVASVVVVVVNLAVVFLAAVVSSHPAAVCFYNLFKVEILMWFYLCP